MVQPTPLPPGWKVKFDSFCQRPLNSNTTTQATQWEVPAPVSLMAAFCTPLSRVPASQQSSGYVQSPVDAPAISDNQPQPDYRSVSTQNLPGLAYASRTPGNQTVASYVPPTASSGEVQSIQSLTPRSIEPTQSTSVQRPATLPVNTQHPNLVDMVRKTEEFHTQSNIRSSTRNESQKEDVHTSKAKSKSKPKSTSRTWSAVKKPLRQVPHKDSLDPSIEMINQQSHEHRCRGPVDTWCDACKKRKVKIDVRINTRHDVQRRFLKKMK